MLHFGTYFLICLLSVFPETLKTTFQLWKLSSEFSAMRSLMMVSLAQRLISMSHSGSAASGYSSNYIIKALSESLYFCNVLFSTFNCH